MRAGSSAPSFNHLGAMELRAESGANPARWIRRESGALDPARFRHLCIF